MRHRARAADDASQQTGTPPIRYAFVGDPLRTLYVDPGVQWLLGLPREAVRHVADLWLEHVHPEDRERLLRAWHSGVRWDLVYRLVRTDGEILFVHDQGWARQAGQPEIFGHVRDVTAGVRLQEELRFRAQLLDAVAQAVVATDADGAIRFWNRAAVELYGWSAEEAIGRSLAETMPLEPGRRGESSRRRADGRLVEAVARHRDGRPVEIEERTVRVRDGARGVVGTVMVASDIGERRQAERRLRSSQEELQRLYAHLQVVREAEQARIARELHDQLGQMLTALKLDLTWLRRRVLAEHGNDRESVTVRLAQATRLVDDTLEAARRIAMDLRPVVLDDLGLEAAIEWLVNDLARRAGFAAKVDLRLAGAPPSAERDSAAYRILQEALTNVARHAEARAVAVRAVHQDHCVVLSVRDDGRGIPAAALRAPGAMGIAGMRERVRAFGGALKVRRLAGGGTRVSATLPDPQGSAAPGSYA